MAHSSDQLPFFEKRERKMAEPAEERTTSSAIKDSTTVSYGAIAPRDGGPATSEAASEHSSTDSTPLLRPTLSRSRRPSTAASVFSVESRKVFVFMVTVIVIIVLVDLGGYLTMAPLQRVVESIICRTHYREHDPSKIDFDDQVEEKLCKVAPVAREIAKLKGWMDMMEALPSLLYTLPFMALSDRIGRKPVAIMSLSGIILYYSWALLVCWFYDVFHIYAILLGPWLQTLGGGSGVISALLFTMVSDLIPVERRTSFFFRALSAQYMATLVAWPLSAIIMQRSPWLPLMLAIALLTTGTVLILLLPETLPEELRNVAQNDRNIRRSSSQTPAADEVDFTSLPRAPSLFETLASNLRSFLTETRALLANRSLATILPLFLFLSVASIAENFLLQYTSEKFEWSFSRASLLPTTTSLIKLIHLTLLLPLLSHFLSTSHPSLPKPFARLLYRLPLPPLPRDLLLLRLSLLLTSTGLLLMGLSPTIAFLILSAIVFSLGAGLSGTARSILSSLVPNDRVGRIFGIAATLQMLGVAIGGPVVGGVFSWGLGRDGVGIGPGPPVEGGGGAGVGEGRGGLGGIGWSGAPFWVAGTMVAVAGGPVFWLGVKGMKKGATGDKGEEGEEVEREARQRESESAVDEESGGEDAGEERTEAEQDVEERERENRQRRRGGQGK